MSEGIWKRLENYDISLACAKEARTIACITRLPRSKSDASKRNAVASNSSKVKRLAAVKTGRPASNRNRDEKR